MSALAAQLGWELRAAAARPAVWLGLGAVVAFELLVVTLLQDATVRSAFVRWFEGQGFAFGTAFSGPTLAQHLVGFAVGGPGVVFVALVAARSVAGDRDDGTLRLVLCRPVSRERVWAVKLGVVVAYTVAVVQVASWVGLGVALAVEGTGPLLVHVPATGGRWLYASGDGLVLYAWGAWFHTAAILTIAVTAFALACLGLSAPTAAAATVAYFFAEDVLRQMPFLESAGSWFLTTYVMAWSRVFEPEPGWAWATGVLGPLAAYDAVALVVAVVAFRRADLGRSRSG